MRTSVNKTFSVEYNTRLSGFVGAKRLYVVSIGGKLKPDFPICPTCRHTDYVENGYHTVEDSIVLSLGLHIKIGQFQCKKCGTFWSSDREFIDNFIQKEKELIKSLMLGCVHIGLSFKNASSHVGEIMGKMYSYQYLHELYTTALEQVHVEKFSDASGIYYYDEQFLLVTGEEVCRLTIKDAVTGKVILDKQTENAQKETIKKTLMEGLQGLPVDAFIVDMRREYPEIIKELFPKAQIQWCIFHLYKLIWKELHDEFGKKVPFVELYKAYELFDVFFDHSLELNKLSEIMKKFDSMKTTDEKSNKELERAQRKEFGEFVKTLKKERRRKNEHVKRRSLTESEKKFTAVKHQIQLYPKHLQKRIRYIDEKWEKFTLFQRDKRVQPTSNGIEHYFAATLSKTDKKDFRSKAAVDRELAAHQAKWNGQKLFSITKLSEVLTLAGMLFLAFPPS